MGRSDGRHMKELDSFQRFYTHLMPSRVQSACWTVIQADASGLIKFLESKRESGEAITVFQLVIAALIRTAALFPELNRFIYGHKYYARKDYTVSFAVSLEEKTVFRKVKLEPEDTLQIVSAKVRSLVENARKEPGSKTDVSVDAIMKLPGFITTLIFKMYPWLVDKGIFPKSFTDDDTLYASAVVSNLGTFGMAAPVHHLYEWGNVSVFVTIGQLRKIPAVMPDGSVGAADMIDFGFTVDERICGGKKLSDALSFFKYCIENPAALELKPEQVVRE